jgi:hypothetical protein
MAMLATLVLAASALGFTALASVRPNLSAKAEATAAP